MSGNNALAELREATADTDASNLLAKLVHCGAVRRLSSQARRELFEMVREKQAEGYDLSAADGTLELLVRDAAQPGARFFQVLGYAVTTRMRAAYGLQTTAEVTLECEDAVLTANASGHGPVNALDLAFRQCLATVYASIGNVKLIDYSVRMLEPQAGTAARVRVLIDWSDGDRTWRTAGVSDDIIEASWLALTDAIRLEMMRYRDADQTISSAVADNSWAV
jgi:2-isopropylmalate synthase